MNADLEQLVLLHAIDLELRHFAADAAIAPKRVADAEQAFRQAETLLAGVNRQLSEESALRRRCESDAAEKRVKMERLVRQLDAATSAAQINALEHELAFVRDAVSKLEDDELASLERNEELEARQLEAQQRVESAAAALMSTRERSAEIVATANTSITERSAERAVLRPQISESALAAYDRVAKARGTGLAEARDHQCSACRMMVRPQRWNDLTGREHDHEIFPCESCGRLLFHDPRRDRPGPWAAGERLAAATQLETTR